MTPRRRAADALPLPPLAVENGEGGRTTRKDDLIAVQGFLNQSVAALGTEVRGQIERLEVRVNATLKEGRDAHHVEHLALLSDISGWRQRQTTNCAALMAPYRPVAQALGIVGWFGRHPKVSAMVSGLVIAASAVVGGLLIPGR